MKPPWDHSAHAAAELEALQTDVMRFVAILGLCLAAIFSLVNGARHEPREPQPAPEPRAAALTEPVPTAAAASAPETPAPLQKETPLPQTPQAPPQPMQQPSGFTLEFESGGALDSLLAAGRIQLFVRADGHFYRYRRGGDYQQADAPGSYYRMDPATVPTALRLRAEGLLSSPIEWGVTLPAATAGEIQRLMSAEQGGNLLIDANAGVRLVAQGG